MYRGNDAELDVIQRPIKSTINTAKISRWLVRHEIGTVSHRSAAWLKHFIFRSTLPPFQAVA